MEEIYWAGWMRSLIGQLYSDYLNKSDLTRKWATFLQTSKKMKSHTSLLLAVFNISPSLAGPSLTKYLCLSWSYLIKDFKILWLEWCQCTLEFFRIDKTKLFFLHKVDSTYDDSFDLIYQDHWTLVRWIIPVIIVFTKDAHI